MSSQGSAQGEPAKSWGHLLTWMHLQPLAHVEISPVFLTRSLRLAADSAQSVSPTAATVSNQSRFTRQCSGWRECRHGARESRVGAQELENSTGNRKLAPPHSGVCRPLYHFFLDILPEIFHPYNLPLEAVLRKQFCNIPRNKNHKRVRSPGDTQQPS